MQLGSAGNRNDPRLLREQPGKRNLRRGGFFLGGDVAEQINQGMVCLARFRRKARDGIAEVGAVELRILVDGPCEKTFAQRTEGNQADLQLLKRRQNFLLRLAPPKGIFALEGSHRLDGMGAANRLRAGFGKAEMLDLTLLIELFDRSRDLFDRHVRIDAMLVKQVDAVSLEPLERLLGDFPDAFW